MHTIKGQNMWKEAKMGMNEKVSKKWLTDIVTSFLSLSQCTKYIDIKNSELDKIIFRGN
jgi:hypothetical protein